MNHLTRMICFMSVMTVFSCTTEYIVNDPKEKTSDSEFRLGGVKIDGVAISGLVVTDPPYILGPLINEIRLEFKSDSEIDASTVNSPNIHLAPQGRVAPKNSYDLLPDPVKAHVVLSENNTVLIHPQTALQFGREYHIVVEKLKNKKGEEVTSTMVPLRTKINPVKRVKQFNAGTLTTQDDFISDEIGGMLEMKVYNQSGSLVMIHKNGNLLGGKKRIQVIYEPDEVTVMGYFDKIQVSDPRDEIVAEYLSSGSNGTWGDNDDEISKLNVQRIYTPNRTMSIDLSSKTYKKWNGSLSDFTVDKALLDLAEESDMKILYRFEFLTGLGADVDLTLNDVNGFPILQQDESLHHYRLYKYDMDGFRLSYNRYPSSRNGLYDGVGDVLDRKSDYYYSDKKQLLKEVTMSGDGLLFLEVIAYSYDAAGNHLSMSTWSGKTDSESAMMVDSNLVEIVEYDPTK